MADFCQRLPSTGLQNLQGLCGASELLQELATPWPS